MRLDKFLKVSRLIKRRTLANEACTKGKVFVNGKPAKPGHEIKENDIIEITISKDPIRIEVVDIREHTRKEEAKEMYRII